MCPILYDLPLASIYRYPFASVFFSHHELSSLASKAKPKADPLHATKALGADEV
jgi:hypothetical protein